MFNKSGLTIFCVFLLLGVYVGGVSAEAPPDAGSLLQDIEKQTELPVPKKETLITASELSAKDAPEGLTVTVKTFKFEGNTVLTDEQLSDAVSSFSNRPVTFAELQVVLKRVSEAYSEAGWVARAFLAPQDIDTGTVKVRVVESIFSKVLINGPTSERIKPGRLRSMVTRHLTKGKLLSATALDAAIRRINELPGIKVSAALSAGENPGETDILLSVKDGPMVRSYISLDNYGSRFTGEERVTGSFVFNSPFALGEQITATVLHASGTDYGQLAATIPVGYSGLRLGAQASVLNYDIISGFDPLGADGDSVSVGFDATYPLIRSRTKNLSIASSLTDTRFQNDTNDSNSKYSVSTFKTSLTGYMFDELGGGGVNQAVFTVMAGDAEAQPQVQPNGQTQTQAEADINLNGEGDFLKVRYSISRQQRISPKFSFFSSLSGQLSQDNLTSSEKFTVGGASGVRAYTSTEGSGDTGLMLNLELRAALPRNISLTAFYDIGRVSVDKDPAVPDNSATDVPVNKYSLKGAGLSASWHSKSGTSLKATWAKAIGGNDLTDRNGSSSDDASQFWLQLSHSF